MDAILAESRAIHGASLVGLAVNAPPELAKHEDRFWADVEAGPAPDPAAALAQAAPMIEQLAYLARVARRQRQARSRRRQAEH